MSKKSFSFATALLKWFDEHGRKNLPWQHPIEPYRVWLSEVMLQQTQVETVIPYFLRFTEKYPCVEDLANAKLDDILHQWTGLGYYARARNLHKCAQTVCEQYGGEFPSDVDSLQALPGIGRSTACAICSIAFGKQTAIMDGNVKRVLTRFHAIEGWPGQPKIEKVLWKHADSHMPKARCADYTQAIMDLGATLCKRSSPECHRCPMKSQCQAYADNNVAQYPGKKPRKETPTKSTVMLIIQDKKQRILLEQRPTQGIWGGLWSFIEFEDTDAALAHASLLGTVEQSETWGQITHVFSHYKLHITPLVVTVTKATRASEQSSQQWVTLDGALNLGLAAPVKRLIETIKTNAELLI